MTTFKEYEESTRLPKISLKNNKRDSSKLFLLRPMQLFVAVFDYIRLDKIRPMQLFVEVYDFFAARQEFKFLKKGKRNREYIQITDCR